MTAEPARATWTDERLDDLSARMDDGFRTVRTDLGARIDRVDARLEGLELRFDALQRTLIQIGGGMIASILVAGAGIAATQL